MLMAEKQRQFHLSPLYQTLHFYLGECPDWPTVEHRLWWQFNQVEPVLRFNQHEFRWSDLYVSSLSATDFAFWFEVWQKYQKALAQIGPKSQENPSNSGKFLGYFWTFPKKS